MIKFFGIRTSSGNFKCTRVVCMGTERCQERPTHVIDTDICYIPLCFTCMVLIQSTTSLLGLQPLYKRFVMLTEEQSRPLIAQLNLALSGQ